MTNDLAALSEAYTNSPNALSLTLLGHALVDEYRAGRLVPVEQRDKAEALLCQRTNEYIEATARAEAAEARNKVLEEALTVLETALKQIAGSHWERWGFDQTDIDEIPDHSGEEAMNIARQALGGEHER